MIRVIHKQGDTALVQNENTNKPSFPVQMMDWLKHLVCIGDYAIIKKNPVTGEWIMTDYIRMIGDVDYE